MFSLKQKKKEGSKTSLKNDAPLTRQEEIEQEEKMRAIAKEKAEKELKKEKQKKDNKNFSIGCLAITVVVIIIAIFSFSGENTSTTDWRNEDNSIAAYIIGERFVKEQLKSPSTAKFPSGSTGHVVKIKYNQYKISSYVDSQNSFGAMIRTNFVLIVEQTGKDNWRLVDIQM